MQFGSDKSQPSTKDGFPSGQSGNCSGTSRGPKSPTTDYLCCMCALYTVCSRAPTASLASDQIWLAGMSLTTVLTVTKSQNYKCHHWFNLRIINRLCSYRKSDSCHFLTVRSPSCPAWWTPNSPSWTTSEAGKFTANGSARVQRLSTSVSLITKAAVTCSCGAA